MTATEFSTHPIHTNTAANPALPNGNASVEVDLDDLAVPRADRADRDVGEITANGHAIRREEVAEDDFVLARARE